MRIRFTSRAARDFESLTQALQAGVEKQLSLLLEDLRHPSLRAKKYDEGRDTWQGRITRDYRFYLTIEGDTYVILAILPHPKWSRSA